MPYRVLCWLLLLALSVTACTSAALPTAIPATPATATMTFAPATMTFAPATATFAPTLTASPLPAATPTSPHFTATGAFFALSVADVVASAAWYSEKLGLHVVLQPPTANGATVVVLEGGGLIVELIQHEAALPLTQVAAGLDNPLLVHGIFKVGVIVDDFDQAVAFLKARDIAFAFGPFPAQGGQRANVAIHDNAGNLIQFFGK